MPQRHRRPRFGGLVGAVCVVVGAVLITAPTTLSAVRGIFDAPDPPQASAEDAIPSDNAISTLSADQRMATAEVLARSPALKAILNGNGYSISEVGPWTDEQGQLLGAAVQLRLENPLSGARAWPLIRYDHSERTTPPYRGRVEHLIVRDATEIDALVDLNSGAVASLQPGGEGVSVAPGPDVVPLPSAGD
jgi:hypothetical protein